MNIKTLFQAPLTLDKRHYRYFIFINYGYILSFLIHTINILLFYNLGVRPLVIHNVISVFIFIGCIVINRRGAFFAALTIGILEFISHAAFCTHYIGWDSGYPNYLFFLAICAYLAPAGRRLVKAMLVAVVCASYLIFFFYSRQHAPEVQIAPMVITVMNVVNLVVIFFLLGLLSFYYRNAADIAEAALEREYERSEGLLRNILPAEIAGILKREGGTIADRFEGCTVIFADMVGFTGIAEKLEPEALVGILNSIFSRFDDIVDRHGLEKIKTIGDSYMIASGLPVARHDHAEAAAECALEMLRAMEELREELGRDLHIRIGINSGPVVAGVIGKKKFTYDLWGDSVNLAARMEYHGLTGEIQVAESTYRLLAGDYRFVQRGRIMVKGKGELSTYLLKGRNT